jgi:4-diphosphocytidyl-2-C-methyl-D-erythritol kinase
MLLRAFAKINLDLRVLGRRADGFHEVATLLQTIDWCDEIVVEAAPRFEFSASDGPQDESNLVVRAVRAFEKVTGQTATVRIHLTKHIPAGAGLGGGSSDAAAMFLGLARLFGRSEFHDGGKAAAGVLCQLGSDVPFFAVGGLAAGTGRGDVIEPLEDATDYALLLVNPSIHIATAEAYSWLTVYGKSNSIEGFRAPPYSGSGVAQPGNDFEIPVFARYPRLEEIRQELLRMGAFRAAMSGSGSAMFGQFRSTAEAEKAAAKMRGRYAVKPARPLSRAEFLSKMIVD